MGLHIDKIDMPQWLEGILDDTPKVAIPTLALLKGIKDRAFDAKVADVEQFNMTVKSRLAKRLPDKLDSENVAAILLHLFDFKMVSLSKNSSEGLLSVYVPASDDIWVKAAPFGSAKGLYVENRLFFEFLVDRLGITKSRDVDEVIKNIQRYAPTVSVNDDPYLFPVNNGIFNQQTGELEPFSPKFVFTKKIGVDFQPTGVNPVITNHDGTTWDVESWLAELSVSADVHTLLWQVIAAALQGNRGMNKSVWFYSDSGNNGKGTVGQLIKNLLGAGNYSSLAVADFNHEFKKADLLKAVANIADENNVDQYIDSVQDYKASVTGDDIIVNRKHKDPVRIQFRGLNIQMMNGLPKTKDKTGSFYRRVLIVPFIKSFTNNGERSYIKSDYINRKEVLEYVLAKALTLQFDEFIVPAESVAALEQYKEKNNPVHDFWNELKEEFVWDLLPNNFLYDLYKKWFDRNHPSGKIISSKVFKEQLAPIVDADDNWENRMTSAPGVAIIYTGKKMDAYEPLITQYGLDRPLKGESDEWANIKYAGSNTVSAQQFKRKANYRGLLRL